MTDTLRPGKFLSKRNFPAEVKRGIYGDGQAITTHRLVCNGE